MYYRKVHTAVLQFSLLVAGCAGVSESSRFHDVHSSRIVEEFLPTGEQKYKGTCTSDNPTTVRCEFTLIKEGMKTKYRVIPIKERETGKQVTEVREIASQGIVVEQKFPAANKAVYGKVQGSEKMLPLGTTDAKGVITIELGKRILIESDSDLKNLVGLRAAIEENDVCDVPIDAYRQLVQEERRTQKENQEIEGLLTRKESSECLQWLEEHPDVYDAIASVHNDAYQNGDELMQCAANGLVQRAATLLKSPGNLEDAGELLDRAEKLFPEHPKLVQLKSTWAKRQVVALLRESKVHLKKQEFEDARQAAQECLDLVENHKGCKNLIRRADSANANHVLRQAQKMVRAERFDEALGFANRCIDLEKSNRTCRKLARRCSSAIALAERRNASALALTAQKKAYTMLSEGRVYEALDEANKCLEIDEDNQKCTQLARKLEIAIEKLKPHHIKDVAVYKEGDGFIVYFSLVNEGGQYVAVPGVVRYTILVESNGQLIRRFPITAKKVKGADFKSATLGRGAFGRSSMIHKTWISSKVFFEGCAKVIGGDSSYGRGFLKHYSESNELYVYFVFKDVKGNVFKAKADLNKYDL